MAENSVRHTEKNEAIQAELNKSAARKEMISRVVPYLGLVFIVLFFTIVTGGTFLGTDNLGNLINQGFVLCMIAIGSSFVYAHGGMDFSIGAVSGVAQLVCGLMLLRGMPLGLCFLVTVLVCALGACCTAGITLFFGVPVFIGSMCVRTSFQGILKTFCQTSEIAIDYQKYSYVNDVAIKVVILVVSLVVGYYLFNYTVVGKYNKALGGNIRTAEQVGIGRKKWIFVAFVLMGICVGIASIFAFFRTGKVTAYTGNGYEFNIMMAIALGGFPMAGGEKSKISSAVIGALIVTCLTNGLGLWGLDATLISGVKGVLFVVIVAISYDRSAGKLVN